MRRTVAELAALENQAMKRGCAVGGSDRYPQVVPLRPRPKREPVREETKPVAEVVIYAFDEALEHVGWCRSRGKTPQDVAESIGVWNVTVSTWSQAVSLVEQEIIKMRG